MAEGRKTLDLVLRGAGSLTTHFAGNPDFRDFLFIRLCFSEKMYYTVAMASAAAFAAEFSNNNIILEKKYE